MENEATTKTPIPIHRESLSCLLSPVSCLLSSVFCILSSVFCLLPYPPILPSLPALYTCRASSTNHPLFAKQSQFQNGQYTHKYSKNKCLCQKTTNNEPRTLLKTKPIQTQFPRPLAPKRSPPNPQNLPKITG